MKPNCSDLFSFRTAMASLLLAATLSAVARAQAPSPALLLIPQPQSLRLEASGGAFTLNARTPLSGEAALVEVVRGVLSEHAALDALPSGPGGITVSKPSDPADALWKNDQAYLLRVLPAGVTIEAAGRDGARYAAQTLVQLLRIAPSVPALTIRDWPAIRTRLAMIATDQGGFQVIDPEYWKRLIRELASYKINAIMPYFDGGTYKYRKYPFLGNKGDDGFTLEKARMLSEYAEQRGVRLIPQQNSLGHLGGVLGHRELQHLRDGGGTINMVSPDSLAFLGDLYDELTQAFPYAHAIHVGGDEFGHDFGKNPQVAARIAEIGKAGVYGAFMTALHDKLRSRNREMMIWKNEQGLTLEAADRMPRDIAVFDWNYDARQDYPSLDTLLEAGFTQPWATPAVTRYYSRGNDWDATFANIRNFAAAGIRRRVPGLCTCTWVHGMWGGRNLFELNLYGLVFSAACGWNPPPENETTPFTRAFALQWLGCRDPQAAVWVRDGIHTPYGTRTEQKFWRDNRVQEKYACSPFSTLMESVATTPALEQDARELIAFCDRAETALDTLARSATRNLRTLDYFKHDVRIQRLAANRILTAAELSRWVAGLKIPKPVPERNLLRLTFDSLPTNDAVRVSPTARISGGTLATVPADHWARKGLDIGPLPLPESGVQIEYDVCPLQSGNQYQQFASTRPSTHHFMAFLGKNRRFSLHTHAGGVWSEQATLTEPCATGTWYRCTVQIRRDNLSFRAVERETGKPVCRSGFVPIDPVGPQLHFSLTDNHGATGNRAPASLWDQVTVSTLKPVPDQPTTPPADLLVRFKRLIQDHNTIEETFRKSVLEAGGGSADTGNLSKGATQFRSRQGREDTEKLLRMLTAGRLPVNLCE